MRLQDVIRRGTSGARPAANTVPIGTIYYSTDTATTDRSDGTNWQTIADSGSASAINQLTGDVTAGPGGGSQAATIANNAVTTAKINNDAVTFAKIQNITDARLLGRSAGSSGDTQEITVGAGLSLSAGALTATGTAFFDQDITKSANQDVTNSATLVDDSELQFSITAGDLWYIQLLIVYSATDQTHDFLWDLAVSAGTMSGSGFHNCLGTADVATITAISIAEVADTSNIVAGTRAAEAKRMFQAQFTLEFSSNATFKFRFAQSTIGAGTKSTCCAKSKLLGKKVSP